MTAECIVHKPQPHNTAIAISYCIVVENIAIYRYVEASIALSQTLDELELELDEDHDGTVSWPEFQKVCVDILHMNFLYSVCLSMHSTLRT